MRSYLLRYNYQKMIGEIQNYVMVSGSVELVANTIDEAKDIAFQKGYIPSIIHRESLETRVYPEESTK